jgi:hypothetical protein
MLNEAGHKFTQPACSLEALRKRAGIDAEGLEGSDMTVIEM